MGVVRIKEKQSLMRVLLLYRGFCPTVRLCGQAPLQFLADKRLVEWRERTPSVIRAEDIEWAQILILIRGDSLAEEKLARLCRRSGRSVLYILDDDLLELPKSLNSALHYQQASVRRHILYCIRVANGFATPSRVLMKKYAKKEQHAFLIEEPSLYQIERKQVQQVRPIRIGFAGSIDRMQDIDQILSNALKRILERYGGKVSIEFFGGSPSIAKEYSCKVYPYTESYEAYQKKMEELGWDIGLAPMPADSFHACKHYNKLVEYCGYGIAGVYSKVPPYTFGVEDGVTGLLCENTTEDWVEALTKLIEDSDLRTQISKNCLAAAKERFSLETVSDDFYQELKKIIPQSVTPINVQGFQWIRVQQKISGFLEVLWAYKWRLPMAVIRKFLRRKTTM